MGVYKITLERKNHWFWSGELIEGTVEYVVSEVEHHYLGTGIKFYGISKTDMFEKYYGVKTETGRKKDVIEHSKAEEYVFSKWYGFIGLDDTQYTQTELRHEVEDIVPIDLEPGTYYYEFKFRMPDALPSVYEEEFGDIRYTIDVCPLVLFRDMPALGKTKYRLNYHVLGCYDLSIRKGDHPYNKPNTLIEELGDCFKVYSEVTTDRHGYVFGQNIIAKGGITGVSYWSVWDPKVSLIMEIVFRGHIGIEKIVTKVIQQEKLTRKNFKNWSFVFEGIPHNLPPTNLGGVQRNIKLKYYIRLNAHVELCACRGCKVDITTDNEVVIGTIPETYEKGQRKITDIKPPPPIFYDPIRQYKLTRQIAPSKKFFERPKKPAYAKEYKMHVFGQKQTRYKSSKRK